MSKSTEEPIAGREVFLLLRKKGHRLPRTRENLIDLILKRKGHWTIQDLTSEVRKSLPRIGIATVYRTVSLLHRENLLTETRWGGGAARYEVLSPQHHDHLTCVDCGEIFEFENERIEELQTKMAKKLGFKLHDHRMELFGECQKSSCKFKARGKPR